MGIATELDLLIPGYDSDGTPKTIHLLNVELSIDKYGKSAIKPKMRVKVRPNRCCGYCGTFEVIGSNEGCWCCGSNGAIQSDAYGTPWAADWWPNSHIRD